MRFRYGTPTPSTTGTSMIPWQKLGETTMPALEVELVTPGLARQLSLDA